MRSDQSAAQYSLIRAAYHDLSTGQSHALNDAYQTWLSETSAFRGPTERKRSADRRHFTRVLGDDVTDFSVEKFCYSVELHLAIKAALVTHFAVGRLRGEDPERSRQAIAAALRGMNAQRAGLALPFSSEMAGYLSDELLATVTDAAVESECDRSARAVEDFVSGTFVDVFQAEHHQLIPKELRHTTGTYYTPDWLARNVVVNSGYTAGASDLAVQRILDPSCGTGVFLVAAADQLRRAVLSGEVDASLALKSIARNFVGIDIDPLAVLHARANLTLAMVAIAKLARIRELDTPEIVCGDALELESDIAADLVIGNPPWVNWEYLPPSYRQAHTTDWEKLGLFSLQGRDRAFSKEDVSALFLATCIDKYLEDGGKLAFIVPQSLLKSALNHRGFRQFSVRDGFERVPYRLDRVDDLVAIRPFDGVANRTIVIYATRGDETTYPVRYRRWLNVDSQHKAQLDVSDANVDAAEEVGEPSDIQQPTSAWTTGPATALTALRAVSGDAAYRARTGVFTGGANAVFHLEKSGLQNGLFLGRNITERAKRQVDEVSVEIEPDYVYPFLRGRDVRQWQSTSSAFILLPHTAETRMSPVPETQMERDAPRTLEYLRGFRSVLDERGGFAGWEKQVLADGFYACQRVGEYTFSDWKVVWRYISTSFTTAVIGPYGAEDDIFAGRSVIPNEKLMSIACADEHEAYYLCGLLSSSPATYYIESRMVSTQIAPHLIQRLRIPKYDETSPLHRDLATACSAGHERVANGGTIDRELLAGVDAIGAKIFGVPEADARLLRDMLSPQDDDRA